MAATAAVSMNDPDDTLEWPLDSMLDIANPGPWTPQPHLDLVPAAATSPDLPAGISTHLLELFFDRKRLLGVEMNRGRFFARLAGVHGKRPHRCLLNAMVSMTRAMESYSPDHLSRQYLASCQYSPIDAVRHLESHFAETCAE